MWRKLNVHTYYLYDYTCIVSDVNQALWPVNTNRAMR